MGTLPAAQPVVVIPHDRRVHLRLRAVFDSALERVAPFFDREQTWSGVSLEYFAYCVLRENYPELAPVDIHVFMMAARRFYAVKASSTGASDAFMPLPVHADASLHRPPAR